MAAKTYVLHRAMSVAWAHPNPSGVVVQDTLPFVNGVLTTEDPAIQAYVEALPAFRDQWITVKTLADEIAAAQVKAKALRDVADKAVAAAQEAESALATLVKEVAAPVPAAA